MSDTEEAPWTPFCRGCLVSEGLVPMWGPAEDLRATFERVTSIAIPDDDEFPAFLCKQCISSAENAQKFKNQCLEVDKKLKLLNSLGHLRAEDLMYLKTNVSKEKNRKIKQEYEGPESDSNEDYYVILVEPDINTKESSSKLDTDPIPIKNESLENSQLQFEHVSESFDTEEMNLDLYDVKKSLDLSGLDLETSDTKKGNFTSADLSEDIDSNIHSESINIRQIFKNNNEHTSGNIIKLEPVLASNTFDSSDLGVDDVVTYSQEEIIVGGVEDTYEIINCDISELNMENLEKHDAKTLWHGNLSNNSVEEDSLEIEKNCATNNLFTCSECGKGFESKEVITGHMLLHENSDSHLNCPYCKKSIKRNFLVLHIGMNHKARPTCDICQKTFATPHNRKRHMMTHFVSKEFGCDICHLNFAQKSALKNHQLLHGHFKNFTCNTCYKEFYSKETYDEHVTKGCKPAVVETASSNISIKYPCPHCDRTFISDAALKSHVYLAHDEQNNELLCPKCGLVVSSKREMSNHICITRQLGANRSHRPKPTKKNYTCSVCAKGFTSHAMLVMHERVHTNERPFKCKKCTFAFKTKTHLTTHQLTHTQVKNFSCRVCLKNFSLKGNLVVHLRTHTGERPYVCNICNQAFIDSKYLKKHKLRRHAMDVAIW